MSKKVRLAVVGCGRISSKHFDAIIELKNDIELVAVCDTNPKRLGYEMERRHKDGKGMRH